LIKHPRYYWLLLAESHLLRRLLGSMAGRIAALLGPTGQRAAVGKQTGRGKEGQRGAREIAGNEALPRSFVPGGGVVALAWAARAAGARRMNRTVSTEAPEV
jgi:hypothetical protein